MKTEVIIVGGGPAGLMAAKQLDIKGISYVLFDKNPLLGKKLLITGGSRCNVTNNRSKKEFINDLTIKHKKFLYSTLNTFGSEDVIEYMEKNGVPLILENDLKYFPKSNKSIDILNSLSTDMKGKIILNSLVKKVSQKGDFIVTTNKGIFTSNYLIIATGSQSFPKTGSTGDGIKFAESFGHETIPFYPAETNVYSSQIARNKEDLQGISILKSTVRIKNTKTTFTGPIMFTHNGVSGPVIQHLSESIYFSLQEGNNKIECSLTDYAENELIDIFTKDSNANIFLLKILNTLTIKRLAKYILTSLKLKNRKINQISNKDKNKIINTLLRYEILIDKVESKENSYVNGGGVSTKEINPKSFESKIVKNLYFIGETVDVHGPIGGYNITIALSSGYSASHSIIEKLQFSK